MARKRAAQRDIAIPPPKNSSRRMEAESDVLLWLVTYFPDSFREAFTQDRKDMVLSIVSAAKYGGDQAIAGPRGEGKTTLAIKTAVYLMVTGMSTFPIVIGKNQNKANGEIKDLRKQLQLNEAFCEDYPEIAVPLRDVGSWSSRARLQTVGGVMVNMELGADHFVFPKIGRSQLPGWPADVEPASNGQVLYSLGIDGSIRGTKYGDKRPTLAIIDDIEDREAAASEAVIDKNEEIIEQDISGLAESAERVSRVMLCTIQNRKCIAYKYTDPKIKPSWRGRRYRKMIKPPDRMDLVDQYIEMRKSKTVSDPDARVAFAFWKQNQAAIEDGCIVSNPASYSKKTHEDGEPLELSAVQAYYNRVADTSAKAVATEIDNDPPPDSGPIGSGLTAEIVSSRISGLVKRQVPANATALTVGIDLGKYKCHWVVCAWWSGAGGCIVDYGVAEVTGTDKSIDSVASEPAVYKALLNWRDELLQKEYIDTTGTRRMIDFCMIDSGTFTQAAYEFVRQVRGPFHVCKGVVPYRPRKQDSEGVIAGSNLHASRQPNESIWLYDLDSNYWKQFVHERFMTPTFDEHNMLRRGSLSLYDTGKRSTYNHNSFAHHIAAEELVSEFKDGKGVKTFWDKKQENNHWLDATYMAAAAGEVCGVKLLAPSDSEVQPRNVNSNEQKAKAKKPTVQHGQRFRSRPGGWIPGRRS